MLPFEFSIIRSCDYTATSAIFLATPLLTPLLVLVFLLSYLVLPLTYFMLLFILLVIPPRSLLSSTIIY